MATAPDTLHMRSSDLIKKKPLDYGGFGEIYLCYHKNLGQVVLKSVFTGRHRNDACKKSLVEEGTLMSRLSHERVVKLLGVIMEEGNYSLVMELIPKGNLQAMLQKVPVPISIKGRITLEILEGMVYLAENNVIHKDLKPENILVDEDFHIKIADLGLATCQSWSRLTQAESQRKSRSGIVQSTMGAGTLSYMAPEHLENINTRSTEKSDVYSFGIVLWVILTCQDPYEYAKSDAHISSCVRKGDRPAVDFIPKDTPKEMVDLMKSCWQQEPQQRPTFEEGYKDLLPFYKKNLEKLIEMDSLHLRELYDGPEGLVEKMNSLTIPPEFSADGPGPLLSSDRSAPLGPVEASIEDLCFLSSASPVVEPGGNIQTDAQAVRGDGGRATVEQKLKRELQYHKNGSYTYVDQPDSAPACQPDSVAFNQLQRTVSDNTERLSSVRPATGDPSENSGFRPTYDLYESMVTSMCSAKSHAMSHAMSTSSSAPSLMEQQQQQQQQPSLPYHGFDRQKSCPVYPVPETTETMAPDLTAGLRFATNKIAPLQDSGSHGLFIQNASAIQIGNNNSLSITGSDSCLAGLSSSPALQEALHKYEHHPVTEEHLDLLRDNIGSNWKQCARRLGLSKVEVEAVDHDYNPDGLQEKVHQMLERWRMKEGSVGCTVGKLCLALDGRVAVDVIRKLLNTYRNAPTSRSNQSPTI